MLKSFTHKGLAAFYKTGSAKGIVPQHARRLRLILTTLDDAATPADVDLPAFGLHSLKGELAGMFSVRVNGNWRVIFTFDGNWREIFTFDGNWREIFTFDGEDVVLVDYLDYH